MKTWADYETKMWQYASDLREKETRIKDGGELVDAQNELKRKPSPATLRARVLPETMSFSAGIPPLDAASQHREEVLTDEVQQWKDEIGIYKAWIRQMDDMYSEELRASSQSRGRSQEKEQKKIEDKSPSDKDLYYPKKPGPRVASQCTQLHSWIECCYGFLDDRRQHVHDIRLHPCVHPMFVKIKASYPTFVFLPPELVPSHLRHIIQPCAPLHKAL